MEADKQAKAKRQADAQKAKAAAYKAGYYKAVENNDVEGIRAYSQQVKKGVGLTTAKQAGYESFGVTKAEYEKALGGAIEHAAKVENEKRFSKRPGSTLEESGILAANRKQQQPGIRKNPQRADYKRKSQHGGNTQLESPTLGIETRRNGR